MYCTIQNMDHAWTMQGTKQQACEANGRCTKSSGPQLVPKTNKPTRSIKLVWVFIIFNPKMTIKHKISNGNVILFPK